MLRKNRGERHPTGTIDEKGSGDCAPQKGRVKTAAQNAILCATVFAVLFGLLELFIRNTEPITTAYDYSACCDYVMRPNQDFRFAKEQFDVRVRTNNLGMRGPAPDLSRPIRLFVLGDSFAFGYGVEDAEAFPARLPEELGQTTSRSIAVINSGHSGYDTRREAAYLREYGQQYKPSIVLVAFVLNDVLSNSGKFWFNAVPDGILRYFPLRATAIFLSYLIRNPAELMFKLGLNDKFSYLDAFECLRENGCQEDWQITSRLLAGIAADARRLGAEPIFVHVPVREEIVAKDNVAAYDLSRAETMLRAISAKNDVLFVPLRDALTGADYYPVDGHWTAHGHEVVARRLAIALNRAGILQKQLSASRAAPAPPRKY